jgi:NAD(P)-dependent dehydrogenase (short-subunit alcohol dehydrogenase family)
MEIQGLTAIITGSTGRLGRAIAMGLAARGMDCICHYHRDAAAAQAIAGEIAAMGRRAAAVQADVGCEADIKRMFEQAAAFGGGRVLVNSAAVFERCPLGELTADTAGRMLGVNLAGPMLTSRYFVEILEVDKLDWRHAVLPVAKIVNLADVAAMKPWAEYAAYCASKAGLVGLTKALAKELAPGILVNAVAPGIVTRPEETTEDEERKQLSRIPAGRFGRAEDIVRSILFLLENDYITGQLLAVDGGRSI